MPSRGTKTTAHNTSASAARRFEVLERCGEGVLFVVYRVRERSSLELFALKALRNSYARHRPFNAAWQRMANASLNRHEPHIAEVFETGVEENTPYLVEEWLPGHSLEDRLRRAPFGHIETASLARRMALGLQELHQSGLAHGDFRPRQVLFNPEAELKITDVGWESAIREGGLSLVDVFPDAAYYLSPEGWSGAAPSPAGDIYALGAVLYRMLAGRVPFDGNSPLAIGERHQTKEPLHPSQFNHDCAPELESIALGMLAKDPRQRQAPFERLLALRQDEVSTPFKSPAQQKPPREQPQPVAATPQTRSTPTPAPPITRKELGKRELKSALLAFFWAVVAIGLLVGIIYGAIGFWMQGAPPEIRVPNYVGMNQTDAQSILQQSGLQMEVGREIYNPKYPTGTILSGQPRPGNIVRSGRQILVTVSRGKEPIRMYDFRDLTLDQTKTIMQKRGLRLGQITNQYSDSIPKGSITDQYPAPGQYFHRYDPINLVVSNGPLPNSSDSNQANSASAQPPTNNSQDNGQTPEDTSSDTNSVPTNNTDNTNTADSNTDTTLATQNVNVNIVMPQGSTPQLVTIVVNDATGEHTVYSQTRQAGDTINQTVQVAKTASSQATVQVFAGGQLLREMHF